MPAYRLKTAILSLLLLAAAPASPAAEAQGSIREALKACCGERESGLVTRLPVHGVPVFEMIVVSDCTIDNVALNPNLS